MTPKKIKTIAVNKGDYKIYLKKAKDFYDMMQKAQDSRIWTAVGLSAVHCTISSCDTILTFHLGIRSAGDDHMQAVDLLSRLPKIGSASEVNTFFLPFLNILHNFTYRRIYFFPLLNLIFSYS